MYNYVYKDDAEELRKGLKPNPEYLENEDGDEATSSGEDVIYRPIYGKFKDHRRQFHVRMCIKANSRREPVQYEYVQFTGKIRLAQKCQNRDPNKGERGNGCLFTKEFATLLMYSRVYFSNATTLFIRNIFSKGNFVSSRRTNIKMHRVHEFVIRSSDCAKRIST